VADEPLFLLRMDTDIALASLASSRAVSIGAECGCGVHDAPPGCAWKHCHEEYVWTPFVFTTSPYHDLMWSYPKLKPLPKLEYNFLDIFEQKPEDTYNEYINPDR